MAKKAVATLHEGNMDGRAYTKVIKMVKSPKTGAKLQIFLVFTKESLKENNLLRIFYTFGLYKSGFTSILLTDTGLCRIKHNSGKIAKAL